MTAGVAIDGAQARLHPRSKKAFGRQQRIMQEVQSITLVCLELYTSTVRSWSPCAWTDPLSAFAAPCAKSVCAGSHRVHALCTRDVASYDWAD